MDTETCYIRALVLELILELLFVIFAVLWHWPVWMRYSMAAILLMMVITITGYLVWGLDHKL